MLQRPIALVRSLSAFACLVFAGSAIDHAQIVRTQPWSAVCRAIVSASREGAELGNRQIVLAGHTIVGRAAGFESILLLTDEPALVTVDARSLHATRRVLADVPDPERIWGLARLDDGTIWTLLDRKLLAQLTPEGRVARRIALDQPHLGLFGLGRELVYQLLPSPGQTSALTAGPPGTSERRPIGGLSLRESDDRRAEVWVRNLVYCGLSRGSALPCWFTDQAVIDLIEPDGHQRQIRLPILDVEPPHRPSSVTDPQQPIWDAILLRDEVLVLSRSITSPAEHKAESPAWHLWRFGLDGRVRSRCRIDAGPRILLDADDASGSFLTWEGTPQRVALP